MYDIQLEPTPVACTLALAQPEPEPEPEPEPDPTFPETKEGLNDLSMLMNPVRDTDPENIPPAKLPDPPEPLELPAVETEEEEG